MSGKHKMITGVEVLQTGFSLLLCLGFAKNNMDFLKTCDRIELSKDKKYRAILRKIKEYEEE